ncbi:hypothetical protein AB835_07465 [Candidatus Endobugula sertula]|uniref:DUF58 domain-containing protein n=1 Tax=Candidatus Endobugula sertula TaxID=62101 RepID=A0A1D2QQ69_9GAMM|nr:hypothetical protein AB835_07465 [Candidatus Endobugula sertula]
MYNLFENAKHFYQRWLQRRIPPNTYQILYRKHIFIFPTKAGLSFLGTIILLWLLGTNYQNNLIIALAFLLLSLLHTCIFYTYANFSGLSIQLKEVKPCFAKGSASIELVLKQGRKPSANKRDHHRITLGFPGEPVVTVDIKSQHTETVVLPLTVSRRGWHHAERLVVSTIYPLGFIRAWAHLDMDANLLAYPQPIAADLPIAKVIAVTPNDHKESTDRLAVSDGVDDISHLRPYQQGDSPRYIS